MLDWLVIWAVGLFPIALTAVLLRFGKLKTALIANFFILVLTAGWFAYTGLGPHGFILIFFLPIWMSVFVSLLICLAAYVRRGVAKTKN